MSHYKAPITEMMFILRDVFNAESRWLDLFGDEAPTLDLAEAVLNESGKLAADLFHPANIAGDKEGCRLNADGASVPAAYKSAWQALVEGGWVGLSASPEFGGQGMPTLLASMVEEMQWATNPPLRLYATGISGAVELLEEHGTAEIQQRYLPRMVAGEWGGTMALTEAHCGTDLGLIRTRAAPLSDGSYAIKGTKISITGGDQDLTENIVHLVLAKLPDAPAGTRGISLFLVPKYLVNEDESLGARNPVCCENIEDKMGLKGSTTCVLNFDAAQGWMIGKPNQGLKAMFSMMNYARINVGLHGLGLSDCAYQAAAAYAKERRQGRAATGPVDPLEYADTLLAHADVRRMLLEQRSYNEAGRALVAYLSLQLDCARNAEESKSRVRAQALADLLTPILKAFATDRGFEGCVSAQQVFGGHGYTRDYPMEQMVRDARIAMIYEGANGVISLDLAGRKVVANSGALVVVFLEEIDECLVSLSSDKSNPWLMQANTALAEARTVLRSATDWLLKQPFFAFNTQDEIGAASAEYLQLFGHVAYAFMWAKMLQASEAAQAQNGVEFASAKRQVARFYFRRVLPRIHSLNETIRSGAQPMMALPAELF